MRYALMIIGDESAWTSLPKEQGEDWYRRISEWSERLGDKDTKAGFELATVDEAKAIRGDTVTDGPYLESKEVFGGCEVITAESLDEAVGIAKAWPGVAEGLVSIEVRRIIEH